jgi:hypothetical protein
MKPFVLLLVPWWAASAQADENFRCGKWIVSSDLPVAELLDKCGEPAQRERSTQDVLVRNQNTGLMIKVGETLTEVWTYDRGTTAPPMVVTVVDGRIRSIERGRSAK